MLIDLEVLIMMFNSKASDQKKLALFEEQVTIRARELSKIKEGAATLKARMEEK